MEHNEIIEFRNAVLDEVALVAEANNDFKYTSFVHVFTEYLSDAGFISDFTYAHYQRPFKPGRRNARVDGYSENIFEETVNLVIADFYDQPDPTTLTKTDAMQSFRECMAFVEESFKGTLKAEIDKSDPAYYLYLLLQQGHAKEKIRKVKIFLISDKTRSAGAKTIDPAEIDGVSIEFGIWTIDRLYENIRNEGETLEIKFSDYGSEPVKCLLIDSGVYPGYMCAMPGNLLANLYEKHDTALLEGNIRSFLSTKVAVNSGIRKTIINEPNKFFIYNNGISATATEVETCIVDGQLCLSGIVDFQIVNGGQTTASLYNSRYKDKSDLSAIYVPMKLTVVEKDTSKEVIPLIAEYANTQNKVNSADFFSNHDFCIKMERYSRSCRVMPQNGAQYDTFWFFERAKGQYTQAQIGKTPAQIREFKLRFPKTQLFTKTDFAKFRNSWACMPDTVSKGAQTNFQKFADEIKKNYDDKANEYNEKYFKDTVALGLLFHATESLVSSQEWYQQGYRAQIVTYSIALLSKLLSKQYPEYSLDFQRIWRDQCVPQIILNELVNITKIVNDSINDPTRQTVNVTQWCKRAECWKRMQESCKYVLSPKILDCCIDRKEELSEKAAARKDSKADAGIFAESEALEYGAENWKRLKDFVFARKMSLTAKQVAALEIAVQIPAKLPSSTQAVLLIGLRDAALNEGFKK